MKLHFSLNNLRLRCVVSVWCSAFAPPVAPYAHHPGDGRLPGEEAGRRERALHSAADAGLSGKGAAQSHNTSQLCPEIDSPLLQLCD